MIYALASLNFDTRVHETSLIDGDGAADQLVAGNQLGFAGLLVKAQGLVGDDGDATQLAIGDAEILLGFGIDSGFAREIEEIGDGLQGIVDLVGDGAGESAYGG